MPQQIAMPALLLWLVCPEPPVYGLCVPPSVTWPKRLPSGVCCSNSNSVWLRGQSGTDETDLSGQMPNHEVPAYNRSSVYKVEHILSHTVCQEEQMGEKQPRPMWRVPLWDMTWVPCGPCGTWPGTLWCVLRGARHDQTDYRSCTMPSYVGAVCVQRGRVEGSHCLAEGTLNR